MQNYVMNLRMFDDGGEGAAETGEQSSIQNVVYGIQDEQDNSGDAGQSTDVNPADAEAEFDALIKKGGKYEQLFNQRMTSIIQKRLGKSKEMQQAYEQQQPVIDALVAKYGVSDVSRLQEAIDADESFYEDAAMNAGMTVEQYKRVSQLERQNQQLLDAQQQREQELGAQQVQAEWFAEERALRESFPEFNLQSEIASNPAFAESLQRGNSVIDSYRLTHFDDLMNNASRSAASIASQRAAVNARKNAARPSENGASARAAQRVVSDPSKLTSEDINAIIAMAQRGEKVRF